MRNRIRKFGKRRKKPALSFRHIIKDGQFDDTGLNWRNFWRDPYHLMLMIPWSVYLTLITVGYIALNLLFAFIYWIGGDCIANAHQDSFLDMFFFSVQTLASIGYGVMYPKTLYANTVVTAESIVGLIGIAMMTGLSFARFSKPTARMLPTV
jgi:inward rectifier potassium channel